MFHIPWTPCFSFPFSLPAKGESLSLLINYPLWLEATTSWTPAVSFVTKQNSPWGLKYAEGLPPSTQDLLCTRPMIWAQLSSKLPLIGQKYCNPPPPPILSLLASTTKRPSKNLHSNPVPQQDLIMIIILCVFLEIYLTVPLFPSVIIFPFLIIMIWLKYYAPPFSEFITPHPYICIRHWKEYSP